MRRRTLGISLLALALTSAISAPARAKTKEDDPKSREAIVLERITVTGSGSKAQSIPGSTSKLTEKELDKQNQVFDDVHRILFTLPGINIQEEEGFGLRPNIGMRGVGNERSSNITLMEDGVLAAPAPYAAPAAYYFPVAARMKGVEVEKGASQVRFGPRTNGGALNLISTPIPTSRSGRVDLAVGEFNTGKGYLNVGGSNGNLGWLVETYQIGTTGFKTLDTGGDTGFRLSDYLGKLRWNSSSDAETYHEVELKGGYTDQKDDETYLGLTDADFQESPFRRYAGSQVDQFTSEHWSATARYFMEAPSGFNLTTTLYNNDFQRNWYKLDKVGGVGISDVLEDPDTYADELAVLRGEQETTDGDLAVKANNRSYYARGGEAILAQLFDAGSNTHDVQLGVRLHWDEEDRHQWTDDYRMLDSGTMSVVEKGTPGEGGGSNNRVSRGQAVAVYAKDDISVGRWLIAPGLRYEAIAFERDQYAADDVNRMGTPTTTESTVNVWVPGLGASYAVSSDWTAFAGVHRGFGPPGPGANDSTQAETSVNTELGARMHAGGTQAEAVVFFNAYDNLIGKDTFASGGEDTGELYNGGKASVYGLEASAGLDLGPRLGAANWAFPLTATYTFTHAEFKDSFVSGYAPWGTVEAGDNIPYIPNHQFNVTLAAERSTWRLGVSGNYQSAMLTSAAQGDVPDTEKTDARFVLDLTGNYRVLSNTRVFASLQNVTDATYIVARRPAGVRPGLKRMFMAGIKVEL